MEPFCRKPLFPQTLDLPIGRSGKLRSDSGQQTGPGSVSQTLQAENQQKESVSGHAVHQGEWVRVKCGGGKWEALCCAGD